jgi:hypothetical protein
MNKIILDTGPLLALINHRDTDHLICLGFFKSFKGEIFISEAVITETIYFLGKRVSIEAQVKLLELIVAGGFRIISQTENRLLREIELMEKYKDVPMDFADATIVTFAEESKIYDIFTLDKDFRIYRAGKRKKPFEIWPKQI